MKKAIALLLVFLFCVSLCACGSTSKGSGVLIEDLERAIKDFDDEAKIAVTESEEGFTFKYEGSILFGDLTITGSANKDKNITQISALGTGINISYFDSLTSGQLLKDMENWEKVPMNKLSGTFMLWNFSHIVKICSEDKDSKAQMAGIEILLEARRASKTSDGWTYTVKSDSGSETVTITAVYVGANS